MNSWIINPNPPLFNEDALNKFAHDHLRLLASVLKGELGDTQALRLVPMRLPRRRDELG